MKTKRFLPYYVHPIRRNFAVFKYNDESKRSATKVVEFPTYDEARERAYSLNGEYLRGGEDNRNKEYIDELRMAGFPT